MIKFLGVFLALIVSCNIALHLYSHQDWSEILWHCNFAAIVLSMAIFFKNVALVNAVLITAIIAQSIWIFDFILELFGLGLGRTAQLFTQSSALTFLISVSLHEILIPIAFFVTYAWGFEKKSLVYAQLIFICLLLPITYVVTQPLANVNCMFFPCDLHYLKNYQLISSHPHYLTPYYMFQQVVFWMLATSISYGCCYVLFKYIRAK
jgi:hypothetical protein